MMKYLNGKLGLVGPVSRLLLCQRNIRLLLDGRFEQFTLASIKHCTMNNSTFLWIDTFYAVEYR